MESTIKLETKRQGKYFEEVEVEVRHNGEIRTVTGTIMGQGKYEHVHVYDPIIAVRYPQGNKIWKVGFSVFMESGNMTVSSPMDHRQRFRPSMMVLGFADQVSEQYRSQHNSQK